MRLARAPICSNRLRWIKGATPAVLQSVTGCAYQARGGTMESDKVYFSRRAGEQRRAAALTGDADLRRRHLELADLLSRRSDPRRSRTSADAPGDRTSGR